MSLSIYEAAGAVQAALETVQTVRTVGVQFNVAGWYELTAADGTVIKVVATVGMLVPGQWKKVKAIATPDPTTNLETVFFVA